MDYAFLYLHYSTVKVRGYVSIMDMYVMEMNTEHPIDFVVDRKNGTGDWLFMCFSTYFEIITSKGIEQGAPGDCIINSPFFPQYHSSVKNSETGFINSWFHCNGSAIKKLIERYNLPPNTLIKTNNKFFFNKILVEIESEMFQKLPHFKESIHLYFEKLLIELSRQIVENSSDLVYKDKYRKILEDIRGLMVSKYASDWSIYSLALKAHLSPSRFAFLYKNTFGISPIDDLIDIRLHEAQVALLSTDKKIEQIANECGFSSLYYFSRVFKNKIGVSPSIFRK